MNEKIEFLKEQAECMKYLFEHIAFLKLEIKSFKRAIKIKRKLPLENKYYLLLFKSQIEQLSILVIEFNKSDFDNIKKEKLNDTYNDIIYGFKRKIVPMIKDSNPKKKRVK